ncbi:MAG: HugZ family protein [Pseudomonadota bacterium]
MNNAREARLMLRAHRYGVLSTISKKFDGYPFGSITPYLVDHDGSLLILISTLAEHTKNILHDPRVSMITHDQRDPHIQTQGRVTVLGKAEPEADRERAGQRYLRYFPEAGSYFAMHDFSFYRIRPMAIRYIGGFGRIHWVDMENYAVQRYPLIEQESDVIAHMNSDHLDTMRNYCSHFRQCTVLDVAMLGIDIDGFDVRADGQVLRFDFAQPVTDAQQARTALVEMARPPNNSS